MVKPGSFSGFPSRNRNTIVDECVADIHDVDLFRERHSVRIFGNVGDCIAYHHKTLRIPFVAKLTLFKYHGSCSCFLHLPQVVALSKLVTFAPTFWPKWQPSLWWIVGVLSGHWHSGLSGRSPI